MAGTLRARFFRVQLVANSRTSVTFFTEPMDPAMWTPTTPAAVTATDGSSNFTNVAGYVVETLVFNGTTWDRTRSAVTGTDSVGTGIAASALLAQYDDVNPSFVTENRFGNLRMTARRALHNVLRDGSGRGGSADRPLSITASQANLAFPDRGAEVDARNRLLVDVESDMFGADPIVQVQPGLQGVALVGPTGDPIDTVRGGLLVSTSSSVPTTAQLSDQTVGANNSMVLPEESGRISCLIQNVGSANIRVTWDGVAASATRGHQIVPGGSITLTPEPGTACPNGPIHAIREGATDSTVSISSSS